MARVRRTDVHPLVAESVLKLNHFAESQRSAVTTRLLLVVVELFRCCRLLFTFPQSSHDSSVSQSTYAIRFSPKIRLQSRKVRGNTDLHGRNVLTRRCVRPIAELYGGILVLLQQFAVSLAQFVAILQFRKTAKLSVG